MSFTSDLAWRDIREAMENDNPRLAHIRWAGKAPLVLVETHPQGVEMTVLWEDRKPWTIVAPQGVYSKILWECYAFWRSNDLC